MSARSPSGFRPVVERLETRDTPAGLVLDPVSGTLTITGSARADRVQIEAQGDRVVVALFGGLRGRQDFDTAAIRRVVFIGGRGNDVFINDTGIGSVADGGAGTDLLQGGTGDDLLLGGGDSDMIRGGEGQDTINGGPGPRDRNRLYGEEGLDDMRSFSVRDIVDPGPQEGASQDTGLMVDLVNAFRQQNGLSALRVNPLLQQAAQAEAELLSRLRSLDHYINGVGPADRARAVGYVSSYVGENVAVVWGYPNPLQTMMNNLIDSPSHRATLLAAAYKEIGIGLAVNSFGEWYAVQMFGV